MNTDFFSTLPNFRDTVGNVLPTLSSAECPHPFKIDVGWDGKIRAKYFLENERRQGL